ncbi:MAG: S8 family serine peptidase [Candidatus Hydrogenedentes bacterium]|nr:S8 family serine peptidase [Candidatus Hydrogenedentota bacterium]
MAGHGGLVRDEVHLVNALVIEIPVAALKGLAAEDAVQWIEPALPRLSPTNDTDRELTQVNVVQAAPYNLDGSGIHVLVYDSATADGSHPDFGERLTQHDETPPAIHSTHVAGTLGGNGEASESHGGMPFQWRGMAPGALIDSYSYDSDSSGIILYTNPGDLEDNYRDGIANFGVDLANNSLGINIFLNEYSCDLLGDYGVTDALIDTIVAGSIAGSFRVVWAAGNERGLFRCSAGFGTIGPPAGAKNHICVGAVQANDDSMTGFSGWGPTDDGRLKPDICAPGSESDDDFGVTSTDTSGGYTVLRGTSMAAPVVSGICALLLQDYRAQFPKLNGGEANPKNSTLKVLLAHTAVDRGNDGPDYQFGYGSVRAEDAILFMRSGNFLEDEVEDSSLRTYTVEVPGGTAVLRTTMAWDDAPGTPNVSPALVNDLDLLAISPSGATHFPWTLDPSVPEDPARQDTADRINNVEQVLVADPETGVWQIRVVGHSVPLGPQAFSLAASPNLRRCSNQGSVVFVAPRYSCQAVASVLLVDCQLDLNPSAPDTASVRVFSSSDPEGEAVSLQEAGDATAVFTGTIALDTSIQAGSVQVGDGDTLSVEYADNDDGTGQPGLVRDEIPVDCTAPQIMNVSSAASAVSARVSFSADEPCRSSVIFGTQCDSFGQNVRESRYLTEHALRLTGLTPESRYFFTITATDSATNTATANNNGNCFTFTTGVRADYFTEVFDGTDIDIAGSTLVLRPDGSVSHYSAFFKAGDVEDFTDPQGGHPLTLEDDDFEEIILEDVRQVLLYGVAYTSLFAGSNGYLTFGASDRTPGTSITRHFDFPRISALFEDLDPSSASGGQVTWKQTADHLAVTWQDVPVFNQPENRNTFQVRMYFDGHLELTWQTLSPNANLVGISAGAGTPEDFLESDLSAYPAFSVRLLPIGDRTVVEGQTLEFEIRAESTLTTPTLTAANLPDDATFGDRGDGSGFFRWTTDLNDRGEYPGVRFTANDSAETDAEEITIAVLSRLDLNGDGAVNAVDVQQIINAALGLPHAGQADVNDDATVDAVDVQLVVNGSLGLT